MPWLYAFANKVLLFTFHHLHKILVETGVGVKFGME